MTLTESAQTAEIAVADTIGQLMHFWGFKRPMGRLWTILHLSSQAMSAAELADTLKMSAGAVSMGLSELEKWGAVRRTWIPGDRRDFFTAEPDIWKLVRRVIKERELSLVRDFRENLQVASAEISEQRKSADNESQERLDFKRQRLQHLLKLAEAGEFLLKALVEGNAIDPGALLKSPLPPPP